LPMLSISRSSKVMGPGSGTRLFFFLLSTSSVPTLVVCAGEM
jgi:hypothetical protein